MNYSEFLESSEWKSLRHAAMRRAAGRCEYCNKIAIHVHHIRYPKLGQKHSLDMLVAVCDRCHDLSHGARGMHGLANAKTIKMSGPFDNSGSVYHCDGLIWASVQQWTSVLRVPYFLVDFLERAADLQAHTLKGGPFAASCSGYKVFRWPPIAAALDKWHRDWMAKCLEGKIPHELNLRLESEQFAKSILQLKEWGYALQERELQEAMRVRLNPQQATDGIAGVEQAMRAIQSLANATETVLTKHGTRLRSLENLSPALREPAEFISVKQRCAELGLPVSIVVDGRMNLSQAVGHHLGRSGCSKGDKFMERLDGRGMMTEVSTWKRSDIDVAIAQFVPEMRDTFALIRGAIEDRRAA